MVVGKSCRLSVASEEEARRAAEVPGVKWDYLRFVRTDNQQLTTDNSFRPAAGTFEGWPKTLKEFTLLDPCCGSGHFLVAAFNLLVPLRMHDEGLSACEACDAVLRENLFGLELDPRCTQIAAFALAVAAWKYSGEDGQPLGYRVLPMLNIACTGVGPQASEDEWLKLAEQSGHPMNVLSREPILNGLRNLHALFSDAPTLGSLIDPNQLSATLISADYETLRPYLSAALTAEQSDDDAHERAVAAAGMVKAAELLAGEYTLVITNVPYFGRGKQDDTLKQHLEQHYPNSKADLATAFVERCLEFCEKDGTTALVTPQNWLFLTSYTKLRESLLKQQTWNLIARLGPGAFETISGEVVNAALIALSLSRPSDIATMGGIDVSVVKEASEKAALLRGEMSVEITIVDQGSQIKNAECRVLFTTDSEITLVSAFANFANGLQTGDAVRYVRFHWEPHSKEVGLRCFQSTVDATALYSGCEQVICWGSNGSVITREQQGAAIRGTAAWGNSGIAVSAMRDLKVTLYLGELYDDNTVVIIPKSSDALSAIWCLCSSPDYATMVRQIDQALKVRRALIEVPFDLAYWQQVAAEKYPDGLPEPESDDPTQWLFHGRPESSTAPLQVAVARLLGYRWSAEVEDCGDPEGALPRAGEDGTNPTELASVETGLCTTSEASVVQKPENHRGKLGGVGGNRGESVASPMRLSARARDLVRRCEELLPLADRDGLVPIPSVRGETAASERLLELLHAAYGPKWSNSVLHGLLTEAGCPPGTTLDEWLRNAFFEQHCKLFGNRPFIWQIWDGRKDGFACLVNYHQLNHKALENLTYAYLKDWINAQAAQAKTGKTGADLRLAAAQALQDKLKLILTGEPPYDIFVRWKPLAEQPIGWHPDLNDGVRMNIRPFIEAGILRKTPNIKWTKDRGKEPQRDEDEYPWFWANGQFTGDRVNDVHLTNAEKQAAKDQQLKTDSRAAKR